MSSYQSVSNESAQIDHDAREASAKQILYTGKTRTTGGRDGGTSRSNDGRLDVKLTVPGAAGNGVNPELLFAAGWSACFIGAMKIAAAKMKVRLPDDTAVDAEVDLCLRDGAYSLQARLNISLPGIEPQVAKGIADAAHLTCPYSKATKGNIDVTINIL
jgi:Ohr subfamily peroxiredoxin